MNDVFFHNEQYDEDDDILDYVILVCEVHDEDDDKVEQ